MKKFPTIQRNSNHILTLLQPILNIFQLNFFLNHKSTYFTSIRRRCSILKTREERCFNFHLQLKLRYYASPTFPVPGFTLIRVRSRVMFDAVSLHF